MGAPAPIDLLILKAYLCIRRIVATGGKCRLHLVCDQIQNSLHLFLSFDLSSSLHPDAAD